MDKTMINDIKLSTGTIMSESFVLRNETPRIMLAHGIVAGWLYYLISYYCLKQPERTAEARSIVIGLLLSLYFVLFGLRLPTKINPIIF